ncbi:hypothetical protein RRF57_011006 [Xylaria bambusicola]|uniref:Uncharacterized protein n=1 Tax=Xylaria bambusicola TaxID=326684 RepID=A0AAN7V270_9PEZI
MLFRTVCPRKGRGKYLFSFLEESTSARHQSQPLTGTLLDVNVTQESPFSLALQQSPRLHLLSPVVQHPAHEPETIEWWTHSALAGATAPFRVETPIGHGRSLRQVGLLAHVFLNHTSDMPGLDVWSPVWADRCVTGMARGLAPDRWRPPTSWCWVAAASLMLVWSKAMLSSVCDFFTPTLGLGCWSGCTLLYAIMVGWTAAWNWAAQFPLFDRSDASSGLFPWRAA